MALSLDEDPNDALASGRTQEELCSIVRLMGAPSIYRQARDDKQKLDKRYNKISFARLENAAKKRLVNYQSRFGVEVPDNSTSVPPSISDFSWATFQALA
ncbi:hypothetical protein FRC00_003663 [Tulasnella sp. 408]|nr:hypothetical protein FRC00_003663 [Tulasnella sp. 408]